MASRVLIAEPDSTLLELLARYLSHMGLCVAQAATQDECQRQLVEFQPAVLLLEPADWESHLLAQIQSERPKLPVILLSNHHSCVDAGDVSQHLVKPVPLSTLYEAIMNLMEPV